MLKSSLGTEFDYRRKALEFFTQSFEAFYEHGIAVDATARVTWISAPYYRFLDLTASPIGKPIIDIISNSFMPGVVESGEPVFLDLLFVRDQWVIVSAIPLKDDSGRIAGAFGFVAIDQTDRIKPLLAKYTSLQNKLNAVQDELRRSRLTRHRMSEIVGISEPMKVVKKQIHRAARFDMAVLICGETGTGKELFAHALHDLSSRSQGPFVSINVAAIPDQLLEAEFFGVAPGAYTGADKRGREGKFQLAGGGTLFLDEIGEMLPELQAKLLRVLQEKEVERVGSNQLEVTDVRIIAATSKDLEALVEAGGFRADLYYRLSTFPIQLPPLRTRQGDMALLCERLLEDIAAEYGIRPPELPRAALNELEQHHWPGNVRELRNVLERACASTESAQIDAALVHGFLPASAGADRPPTPGPPIVSVPAPPPTLAQVLAAAERQAISEMLDFTRGNKTLAARHLGIARPTLYEKLNRLGIS